MKYSYSDYCVCPVCRGDLIEENQCLRCSSCNKKYLIVDGIPALLPKYESEVGERYRQNYEKIASNFLATNKQLADNVEARHATLLKFVGRKHPGRRVLDIGSSHGLYLEKIDADFKVAFDIALTYLKVIPKTSGIVPIQGDAEALPFKPGFFDVIIIADILEHILHPEKLTEILYNISDEDTRIFIHIPWEEDLSSYIDAPYEFTHLRNFSMYTFSAMWYKFYICRYKDTFPSINTPVVFALERFLPRFMFKILMRAYYYLPGLSQKDANWRMKKFVAFPKDEWWLLRLFKPVFRMFELKAKQIQAIMVA